MAKHSHARSHRFLRAALHRAVPEDCLEASPDPLQSDMGRKEHITPGLKKLHGLSASFLVPLKVLIITLHVSKGLRTRETPLSEVWSVWLLT